MATFSPAPPARCFPLPGTSCALTRIGVGFGRRVEVQGGEIVVAASDTDYIASDWQGPSGITGTLPDQLCHWGIPDRSRGMP
jgi:hypothetical protein